MAAARLDKRERATAGLIAGGIVALLLWALIVGLAIGRGVVLDDGLKLFGVLPPPPPPPPEHPRPKVHNRRPQGAAAPPNLRAKPTEVVAPKPVVIPPPVPQPVVVAPVAATGAQASAGAADVPGPGTGAGGEGDGFGAGGDGDGDGAGERYTPPRHVGGSIRFSDYPAELREQGIGGTVRVRFVVAVNGRVPSCQVTRSSGNRLLDETTCRIITQRYRFRPELDSHGNASDSVVVETHTWESRIETEERWRD